MSFYNICEQDQMEGVLSRVNQINKFIFDQVCGPNECQELLQIYKNFYSKIIKKTRQSPVNVFTTNYDLYNENALDTLGIMYNNGFLGSSKRIFNPNSYNYIVV